MKRSVAMISFLVVMPLFALRSQAQQAPAAPKPAPQTQTAPNAGSAPAAKIDPVKEADIRRLQEVMGGTTMVAQVMDAMTKNMRPLLENSLPPGDYRGQLIDLFLERFRSKIEVQHFLDLAVPMYDKYLSDDEIKGLIAFYQTPLGQKTLKVLPQLTAEMQSQGQAFGAQVGRDAMLEVLAEHPELAKGLEDAQKGANPQ